MVKNLPAMQEVRVRSLGQEDPLEKGMATHSSILAWRISWMEELGGLQSMELRRIRHNWATNTNTCVGAGSPTSPWAQNILNSQYLKFSVFYEAVKIKAHPPTPVLAMPSRRGLFSVFCFHLWVLTSFKSELSQSSSYCCQQSIANFFFKYFLWKFWSEYLVHYATRNKFLPFTLWNSIF